jgi:hypothetical protein
LWNLRIGKELAVTGMAEGRKLTVEQNLSDLEYLLNNNIIEEYTANTIHYHENVRKTLLLEEKRKLRNEHWNVFSPEKPILAYEDLNSDLYFANMVRLDAAIMSLNDNDNEYYPVFKSTSRFEKGDLKGKVVNFLLSNIPEPDSQTTWEQIIDFRSDEDTKLKYLALVDWVNDIARANYTISEIKDKYEYLYLDYKRSYEKHKIKSTFTTLEIVAAAGAAFFTSNIPMALSLASNFLKIGTSTLNLLKEEGTLPGKEIAYIYHANKEFDK